MVVGIFIICLLGDFWSPSSCYMAIGFVYTNTYIYIYIYMFVMGSNPSEGFTDDSQ